MTVCGCYPSDIANMNCPAFVPQLRRLVQLGLIRCLILAAGLLVWFSDESRAATVVFVYDVSGNESSQLSVDASVPVITAQPYNKQIVVPGGSVGFSVNVSSVLPVTYQWYFNGTAIQGATGDSLLLTNFVAANLGNYTVKITNSEGSVTSAAATPYIDTNGNGLPDSWEMAYFGNLNQSAGGDYDGDGISNLQEFYNGTNPTVRQVFYWNVASGNFTNALNWIRPDSPGVIPQAPGAGDTAIINSGTFTLLSNTTIAVTNVTVNVPFTAPTDSDYTLNIAGSWTFNGIFTLTTGKQFAVIGGGTATVAGSTVLNGANLLADYGAQLSFPNVTSFTVPAGANVTWTAQSSNGNQGRC